MSVPDFLRRIISLESFNMNFNQEVKSLVGATSHAVRQQVRGPATLSVNKTTYGYDQLVVKGKDEIFIFPYKPAGSFSAKSDGKRSLSETPRVDLIADISG